MKKEKFEILVEELFDGMKKIRVTKGEEYQCTEKDDVLMNFKRGGDRLGYSSMMYVATFMDKHYNSVCSFAKNCKTLFLEDNMCFPFLIISGWEVRTIVRSTTFLPPQS